MNKLMGCVFLWLVASIVALGQANATAQPSSKPAPPPSTVLSTKTPDELRRETFEMVWRTVNEKHFDPTFGGVDWNKIHEIYKPRVANTKSDEALYVILEEMLGELHQSHFEILPPQAMVLDGSKATAPAGIGLHLQIIDQAAVVTRVASNSSSSQAGIRTGFVVDKVENVAVANILKNVATLRYSAAIKQYYASRLIMAKLDGKLGTQVRLTYIDGRDQKKEVILERRKTDGEMSVSFGNLPPLSMEFETKRLTDNIGYLHFNFFLVPLMSRIRASIRSMRDATGIIIDLRDNPGGVGIMSTGIAALLEDEPVSLGTMKFRSGFQNFIVNPQKPVYTGPIVILIDGSSMSTSEILAAGLQELGRAVLVGQRSGGAALPSLIERLPTGAFLQFAFADFKTPHGSLIEGHGVKPDLEVALTRDKLLAGHDAQLEAAVSEIKRLGTGKRP